MMTNNTLHKQIATQSRRLLDKTENQDMGCKLFYQADEYIIEIELDSS